MTPIEFVAVYGGYADTAAKLTGLNRWAILTQWALETGWCAPNSGCVNYDLAGIEFHGLYSDVDGFEKYPNLNAFVDDYSGVLHQANMAVILRAAGGSIEQQLVAFGESPWAGSHYNDGQGPGSSLIALWNSVLAPLAVVPPSPPVPPVVQPPSSDSGGLSDVDRDYLYGEIVKLAHASGVTLDPPPWADPTVRTYVVKPGDSLSAIAAAYLHDGNRWPEIYKLNESVIGPNPDLIHPGQVLALPAE